VPTRVALLLVMKARMRSSVSGGDATAVAQPRGKLAVVDGAPSESRLGKSAVAAIVGNLLQQFLGVHDCAAGAAIAVAPWVPSEASFALRHGSANKGDDGRQPQIVPLS